MGSNPTLSAIQQPNNSSLINKSKRGVIRLFSFKQYIEEVFDSSYPYDYERPEENLHQYSFKTPKSKNEYVVEFQHEKRPQENIAHLCFVNGIKTGNTNEEGHSSHKVFSTVKKIIHDHLAKHPFITHLHFTGENSTEDNNSKSSRSSLYGKMLVKHGLTPEIDKGYYASSFKVPLK